MNLCPLKILAAAVFFISGPVCADDFYIIIGTHKVQKDAQQAAATKGGWV